MEKPIYQEIDEARKLADRTGLRVQRRVDKQRFLKEFPAAAADPRMALTPDPFVLEFASYEELTVGDLRELCLKIKDHPLAVMKALQVEGFPDGLRIHILKEEIQILNAAARDREARLPQHEEPDDTTVIAGENDADVHGQVRQGVEDRTDTR